MGTVLASPRHIAKATSEVSVLFNAFPQKKNRCGNWKRGKDLFTYNEGSRMLGQSLALVPCSEPLRYDPLRFILCCFSSATIIFTELRTTSPFLLESNNNLDTCHTCHTLPSKTNQVGKDVTTVFSKISANLLTNMGFERDMEMCTLIPPMQRSPTE